MAAKDEAAFEAEQEVLPDGLDALEAPPVEERLELLDGGARVRRLDLERLADEDLQPARGEVERVALGHAGRVCPVELERRRRAQSPRRCGACSSRSTGGCFAVTTRTCGSSAASTST